MLYIGADHNGFRIKEKFKKFLIKKEIFFVDFGAYRFQKTDDYPDYAKKVCRKVGGKNLGVLFCGSGHGMVIVANKIKGIRAIMPLNKKSARDGRRDDHANVLVFAAWECPEKKVDEIFLEFIKTKPGQRTRYLRRLEKIRKIENK